MNTKEINFIELNDMLNHNESFSKKSWKTSIDAMDDMGNILFEHLENNVVLAGAIYTLEKLFNVRSSLTVETLNNIMGINNNEPASTKTIPMENSVCLWAIGTGGSGDSIGSVRPVNFFEREVGTKGHSTEMIPFRVTSTPLTGVEAEQYYFRKDNNDGTFSYFLKKFEAVPVIKVLWKDAAPGEDGSEVASDVYNTNRTEDIEVFIEVILKLNKKDAREYFQKTNQIENCHINSIALVSGIKKEIAAGQFDYSDARMITKLNFGNEMLENKEITFRYRIYTN